MLPPPPPPPGPPAKRHATDEEAGELVAPVVGKATAHTDELVPQEAQQKTVNVRRQPPSRKLEPGDLVCGECGEGNVPTRKFCSRCGTSLAEAQVARIPWWRRLFRRRGAKVRKSGERAKRRGRGGKSKAGLAVSAVFRVGRRVVSVVLLLAGILYGVYAPFRGWVNDRAMSVKAGVEGLFFPTYEPVRAAEPPVSPVQLAQFPGTLALDGLTNTFWAAPVGGPREPVLQITFDREVDLARLIVHNGQQENFKDRHRAQRLHLVFSTGKTTDLNLQDRPDPQTLEVENGENATSVEIHILSTFKAVAGNEVAITEIELFEQT
ncbi:zinc ribbon domain-containing protein [Actinophytocola sediminis]